MPTAPTKSLLDAALALPASDRALIADALIDSLDPLDPEVEQAILRHARQRLADYDSGTEEAISVEDVLKELDEMLKEVESRRHSAEAVMCSLEPSDPEIERAWAEEAQSRFRAYKAGKLESISLGDIFNSRGQP